MPYRLNPSYKDQYYHVYNRGNNREQIYFEKKNYSYFLKKVFLSFDKSIELVAYCLMPNHYHLVVKTLAEGQLEKAMQRISTGYTRAINKAYNRTGHLFAGRYKNKIIPGDEYLLHLCRYIHLNPVRAGLVKEAKDWEFSSYQYYLDSNHPEILNIKILLGYFNTIKSFIDFHKSFQEEQNYYVKDLLF